MKKVIKILALISIAITMSCEELGIYDCDDCISTIPRGAFLKVNVIQNSYDEPYYHIKLYRGKVEDNILIDERDTHAPYTKFVDLNQEYSAVSTIIINNVEYNAVSSTTPKLISYDDYCETNCYIITDDELDLRLKYY